MVSSQQAVRSSQLSETDVRELCRLAREGDGCAQDRLLRSHLGLVIHVAEHFYRPGAVLDFGDLVQEGCLGLLHAIDKFDPDKRSQGQPIAFSTYASYWICHSIRREIANHGRTIAVPIHRLRDAAIMAQLVRSLDRPLGWDAEGADELSQVADPTDTPEEWCRDWEARQLVEQLLSKLSERSRVIIRHRYGLERPSEIFSQEQVGEKLGITSARVGQNERASLYLLREHALEISPQEAVLV